MAHICASVDTDDSRPCPSFVEDDRVSYCAAHAGGDRTAPATVIAVRHDELLRRLAAERPELDDVMGETTLLTRQIVARQREVAVSVALCDLGATSAEIERAVALRTSDVRDRRATLIDFVAYILQDDPGSIQISDAVVSWTDGEALLPSAVRAYVGP